MTEPLPNRDLFEKYITKSNSPESIFDRSSLSPNMFMNIREKVFCTESNVDQCIAYLNQVGFISDMLVLLVIKYREWY